MTSAKLRGPWYQKVYFLKLHKCACLRARFEFSIKILTSFRQAVIPPLKKNPQKPLVKPLVKPRALTTCLIFTYASDEGCKGFILTHLNKVVSSSKFKDCQKETKNQELHIKNYLPLNVFWIALGKPYKTNVFKLNIDNSNACRILSVCSAEPHLQNIAIDNFTFYSKFNINLNPYWIPREQNELDINISE